MYSMNDTEMVERACLRQLDCEEADKLKKQNYSLPSYENLSDNYGNVEE